VSGIVFGFLNDRFWLPSTLSTIFQQVAVVGTVAVAQSLVILTAGIDLAVGATMVLSSIVMAKLATDHCMPGLFALIGGVLVGGLSGLAVGAFVTRVKLPPFIVTLATLNIFTSWALLYSKGKTISGSKMPGLLTWTGKTFSVGSFRITTGVVMMVALYIVMSYALQSTAWGRHVYATGDDKEAAALAGIRVNHVLVSVWVTAGVILGLAGWILIGRVGSASPNAAADVNLDSITAVVIGGISLFGGRGRILGALMGALIVGVFRTGLSLAHVDVLYQRFTVGVLILAAVIIDQWLRKVRS